MSDKRPDDLMKKLGRKTLVLDLDIPLTSIPASLSTWDLSLGSAGSQLVYNYLATDQDTRVSSLLTKISDAGIIYKDIHTNQSSLEEIFIQLVKSS